MKTYATLTAAAALWGITSLTQAATLAGSFLQSSIDAAAACYIRNIGPTPIALEVHIFSGNGSPFTPTFQNCNAVPLAPGTTCVVLINDVNGDFVACSAKAAGSVRNLRGTLEVRDPDNGLKVLVAEDLR